MKKIIVLAIAILSVLMLVSLYPTRAIATDYGSRADLDIIWYTNSDTAFTALQNDEVDMIQWSLTDIQKVAVEGSTNLQIGQYVENGMMEFDLNNNLTIIDYPTSTNPCHVTDFRRFISRMTDKEYIISNILLNTGSRIDVPVCYPQYQGWVEPSVVSFDWNGNGVLEPGEDNYPYPYSVTEAVNLLCDMGFSDTDANGYLNYPNDAGVWMDAAGIDTTAMPLKICIRLDHAHRDAAGQLLVAALEGNPAVAGDGLLATSAQWAVRGVAGGDLDTTDVQFEQVRAVLSPIVMGAHNFNVYTGGWSFGRYPTYLFSLFHSMFDYSYGPNYVTDSEHPLLDGYLEDLYYAANIADSQAASLLATAYMSNNVCNIPLWSYTSYVAWRKELAGVVNMKGVGTVNDWTFLNAWRTKTTDPLRFACVSSWDILNIMYSQWYFEYALLDRVTNGLIAVNPYDLAADIPWGAQDWEAGTWLDPRTGLEKTKVTYWLRPDAGAAAPVSGNFTGFYDASDYEFTCWYNYAYDDDWAWSSFMDINHIFITGCGTAEVYFDDVSMWFVYAPVYPLLGPSAMFQQMLCGNQTVTFAGSDLVESPPGYFEYTFTLDRVVSVINATVNGVPMMHGVDFYIRAGYDTFTHNIFVPMRAFAPGDVITISYFYALPGGAGGTYLGGNLGYSWEDVMYSYGYMYPVSISSTSAALNRNPYFQMEMIPKGEIDFRWNYVAGPKPRKGFFKIDILDVVKCTGAYCTRGDGVFNPSYLAGADLDDSDVCHIGILDLVTITGKYAQTFARQPTTVFGAVGLFDGVAPTVDRIITGLDYWWRIYTYEDYRAYTAGPTFTLPIHKLPGWLKTTVWISGGSGTITFSPLTGTITITRTGTWFCGYITLTYAMHTEYIHWNFQQTA